MSLDSIRTRLNPKAVAFQLPIGAEDSFSGLIDLLTQKAYKFEGSLGEQIVEIEIPEASKADVEKYRNEMIERIVECD